MSGVPLEIGAMNSRVVLLEPTGDRGGYEEHERWASVDPIQQWRGRLADPPVAAASHVLRMHWEPGRNEAWRVRLEDGGELAVLRVSTLDGRTGIEMQCGRDQRMAKIELAPGEGARAEVVAVCGPPAAGKTTYVEAQAGPNDLIVDVDRLVRALATRELPRRQRVPILPFVLVARDAVIARLARPARVSRAWIVTSQPSRDLWNSWSELVGAEIRVLAVPPEECVRRARSDSKRDGIGDEEWEQAARDWWAGYRPSEGDRVIEGGSA